MMRKNLLYARVCNLRRERRDEKEKERGRTQQEGSRWVVLSLFILLSSYRSKEETCIKSFVSVFFFFCPEDRERCFEARMPTWRKLAEKKG